MGLFQWKNPQSKRQIFLILFLFEVLISSVTSYPTYWSFDFDYDEPEVFGRSKRQAEGPGDPFISLVEKYTMALDEDWFADEKVVLQKIDKLNQISKYNDPYDQTTPIFERDALDTGKDIVVLSDNEDHRQVKDKMKKRTYIVLRRVPESQYYHAAYAYIRDALPTDNVTRVEKVNGESVTVEWDSWEERSVTSNQFRFGWLTCAYTLLVSCTHNETAIRLTIDPETLEALERGDTDKEKLVKTSVSTPESNQVDIKIEPLVVPEGFNAEEYSDLYGDFDLSYEQGGRSLKVEIGEDKGARSLTGTFFDGPKKKKNLRVVHEKASGIVKSGTTGKPKKKGSSGLFGSLMGNMGFSPPKRQTSNADAVFGMLYRGLDPQSPQIFLLDKVKTPVSFIPVSPSSKTIHGLYVPGSAGYPDSFAADNPKATAKVFSSKGTMLPDGMASAGISGGIYGSLTGDSFRPESLGTSLWFDPSGPEAKGVWSSYKKDPNTGSRPTKTKDGQLITYGVYFPGSAGSADIFVPYGQGIDGTFVSKDENNPTLDVMAHGIFEAGKPAGHGTFVPDNATELLNHEQIKGAFMPDGMELTGMIVGLIAQDLAHNYVFVVDSPGQEFEYFKGKNEIEGVWTPFLAPGEWKPPKSPGTEEPSEQSSADSEKKTKAKMSTTGVKFESTGDTDMFIPDNYGVAGKLAGSNPDNDPIKGELIVKSKPLTLIFRASDASKLKPLYVHESVMFFPDGISPGNGILSEIKSSIPKNQPNVTLLPIREAKFHFFVKTSDGNLWTPFVPPYEPPEKRMSLIDRVQLAPFFPGGYISSGRPDEDPLLMPNDGAVGCFYPDNKKLKRSCGTYFPNTTGSPGPHLFIEDVKNSLAGNTKGNFIPFFQKGTGEDRLPFFHATYVNDTPPTKLVPDDPRAYKGWSQTEFKMSRNTTTTTTKATKTNETIILSPLKKIPIGSGWGGYPTNGKGFDALVDPNHPIFKEYLQWKSTQDRSIKTNEKLLIFNTVEDVNYYMYSNPQNKLEKHESKTSYVSLDEYKIYLTQRYVLKRTRIKTDEIDQQLEMILTKAAEAYFPSKKAAPKKEIKIRFDVGATANAGAGGGAGDGSAASTAGGGVTFIGGTCGKQQSTSALATAEAKNGSSAAAESEAINGGHANSLAQAQDGSNADAKSKVVEGGLANSLAIAKEGANASSDANAQTGGVANAAAVLQHGGNGSAESNATKTDKTDECDGGIPDEIEVNSHAAAEAIGNGTGSEGAGDAVSSAKAETKVRINMGDMLLKLKKEQEAKRERLGDDYTEEDQMSDVLIQINSNANAGGASGRYFGAEGTDSRRKFDGSEVTGQGLRLRGGWKTEYKLIVPNCTMQHENSIFYGFGSCPNTGEVDANELTGDPEAIVDFYLKVLRLNCNSKVKIRVMTLFNDGFLTFAENGNYLEVPLDNSVREQPKIEDSDLRKISTAFELMVFSRTYDRHLGKGSKTELAPYIPEEGGGAPLLISRSVRFFHEFALNYMVEARRFIPLHSVRMTRNLLITIKSLMTKLMLDRELLNGCKECVFDQEVNRADSVYLMALSQFIVHGLAPYEKGIEPDITKAFRTFLQLNGPKFHNRIRKFDYLFRL